MELHNPYPQISIDESMVCPKCRLSFIQYLPKKPVKWGIKLWVCADTVNGYIYIYIYTHTHTHTHTHPLTAYIYVHNFDVYYEANPPNIASLNGAAYGTIFNLIEPCLQQGYTVYMYNNYSLLLLYKDLLAAGTTVSETLF